MDMKEKIHDILDKLNREEITEEIAVDSILLLYNVMPSLPSHIRCGVEAKLYANEMNSKGEFNSFHELDFYNGTVWLRQMIEGNEA